MPAPHPRLGEALDDLLRRYDRTWLDSDPLRWPRLHANPEDREVAAVVAALLAYGRVTSIQSAVGGALAALGPRPARTLLRRRRGDLARRLAGWRHRWTDGSDLAWLLEGVARIRHEHGSLGSFVGASARDPDRLRSGLAAWHRAAREVDPTDDPRRRRARAFLLPDPLGGSAAKRLLLLARWCVRPDDGLDLGLWTGLGLSPRDLVLPLDTHLFRLAQLLGLTRRRSADARTADEITRALAQVRPEDPTAYDFALVRPGILGRCRYRFVAPICGACPLASVCSAPRRARIPPVPAAATT
jgi:uncharacterized protein (TIGR02757 family)